ncbi:MAG TPA: glycosyltransferase family 2 protein [Candidatus Nanopelagicaceae bacterium]|nr:glycosyltransferase family 2 protein [Candidatus Nanopelagicaceae bacterium]
MSNFESTPTQPRVLAVLVTHDGARWLPEVLIALNSQTKSPDRIIAVDTGSTDRTREILDYAGVEVVAADRDCGFGEAINLALVESPDWAGTEPGSAHEWLWLIHDDFAPAPDALELLLAAATADPSVAIAGPKLRGWHDREHLLEVGISIAGNGARWTGLERRERDQGQHDGVREVLSVSTAGMLVRADVLHELGGFDPHLSLFRDDVDFGWRAHVAGHRAICVTEAVGIHAEAAATERRKIDVDGAVFHRPHLLDRRNANYVLLVNCSSLRFVPELLRLTVSTALRAVGYFLAKLPGYAADETAALVLVLTRFDLIRSARKKRKKLRLLPANSVNRFLAPNRELIRSSFDAFRALVFRGAAPLAAPSTSFDDARMRISTEDYEDVLQDAGRSVVRKVLLRPVVAMSIVLAGLALVAGRNRLGALAGGALLPAPNGSGDFLSIYLNSWHPVSLGSAVAAPPWLPFLALAGLAVAGKAPLLITLLFLVAIPASAAAMYALMRKVTSERWLRVGASVLYALSPSVVTGIVDGHLSIVVISWLLPLLLLVAKPLLEIEKVSWRRIWSVGLLSSIVIAFAPIFALLLLITLVFSLVVAYRTDGRDLLRGRALRLAPLLASPLAVLFPWSLSALIHPTLWIQDPGLRIESGHALGLVLLSPGGLSAPPYWIGAGLCALLVMSLGVAANRYQVRHLLLVSLSILALAVPLSAVRISGQGSVRAMTPWLGSLTLSVTIVLLCAGVLTANGFASQLSSRGVGRDHVGTAVMVVILAVSALAMSVWFVGPGAVSENRANRTAVVPAFIQAASKGEQHPRTLLLEGHLGDARYAIVRDRPLQLGDAELIGGSVPVLDNTVAALVAGGTQNTSVRLGLLAIRYVFLAAPIDQSLLRSIDGVGGLSRVSSTARGILWKVGGVTSRVRFMNDKGYVAALPSDRVGAGVDIKKPGRIVIADRNDPGWRALEDGVQLTRSYAYGWATAFGVTKPGRVLIVHDSTKRRAGISLQFLFVLGLLIFILPSGRKKRDRPDQEVA